MRMMMKVVLDNQAANKAVKDGQIGRIMAAATERMKPEAAFFGSGETGERTAYFVFDMKEPSHMVSIAEPFFMELNAKIHTWPVMNAEDLQKGLASIQHK
jgi:hypothetical protein